MDQSTSTVRGETGDDDGQDQLEQFLKQFSTLPTKVARLQFISQLTPRQCGFIRQVSYNILFNSSMQLPEPTRKYFKWNISKLRLLGSIRICAAEKRSLLNNNHLLLRRMATVALGYLTPQE